MVCFVVMASSGIRRLLDYFLKEENRYLESLSSMESNRRETAAVAGEEMIPQHLSAKISQYVNRNRESTNTQLFEILALLNAYDPEAFLFMSECQRILGPPDPIHGGPPFETRMRPFTALISGFNLSPQHVRMNNQKTAEEVVDLLMDLKITRSSIVKRFMSSLCGDQAEPHTIQNIKDLLTKREMGENGKQRFSNLINDIIEEEKFHHAVSVLKTASEKFRHNATYPQNLARLYYSGKGTPDYEKAKRWAITAIGRAPKNSYVADTLGQIHKNCLIRTYRPVGIIIMAETTFIIFEDVEKKAEAEEGPEMADTEGTEVISNSFNNRGRFGFIQVAKIVFEKSKTARWLQLHEHNIIKSLIQNKTMKVEAMFDFFEWYLTYSKPNKTTWEPDYFWRDVALCYYYYTTETAAESTSFAGLLDCLNHGLFVSKGRRARLYGAHKNVSELEEIQDSLKNTYEQNRDDVKVAERYILSNIILSNKKSTSSHLTSVDELKRIIFRFLGTEVQRRSPEFYLLVLLLFWPENQALGAGEDDKEENCEDIEDDGSDEQTWEETLEETEQETEQNPAQLALDLIPVPDLEQYAAFMEKAYERAKYAKYLRGRYLLPLFFLGKGSGLSKWIHKSRIDDIVERKVDEELNGENNERNRQKVRRINEMWTKGEVWQVAEVKDILLPLTIGTCHSPMTSQELNESDAVQETQTRKKVFVDVGGKQIQATIEAESDAPGDLLYLAFTIQGAVVFKVGYPHMHND